MILTLSQISRHLYTMLQIHLSILRLGPGDRRDCKNGIFWMVMQSHENSCYIKVQCCMLYRRLLVMLARSHTRRRMLTR